MNRRMIGVLLILLACGDWLVSPTIAQRDEPDPTLIPIVDPAAFLSGTVQARANIEGLDVSVERDPNTGVSLVFHNVTRRSRSARFMVEVARLSGSPFARLVPTPQVVDSERIEVSVAPGETVRRRLEAGGISAGLDGPSPLVRFTTILFRLRPEAASPDVPPLAELRLVVRAGDSG